MKKETRLLSLAIILYVLPILAFGDFSNIYQWIFLPLFSIVIYHRLTKSVKSERAAEWWTCIIISMSTAIWGLKPFSVSINHTIIGISFTWANILGYWLSMFGCYLTGLEYRRYKIELYEAEFGNDEQRLNRDKKINNIIKKWW